MEYTCKYCLLRSFEKVITEFPVNDKIKEDLTNKLLELMSKTNSSIPTPEVARMSYKLISEKTGIDDLFKEEKLRSNHVAMQQYDKFSKKVSSASDPFDTALRLSIAGNIMDFATCPDLSANGKNYLNNTVEKVMSSQFAINHSDELKKKIDKANTILMLGDNTGEIVLDMLFIETIKHPDVYFAVRGFPVLNDATLEDAYNVGINSVAHVISNGYGAPSTILKKSSIEFQKIFDRADLIISKGQGNLEGLLDNPNNKIFFMMMVKCEVIAKRLGVKKGEFVVVQNNTF